MTLAARLARPAAWRYLFAIGIAFAAASVVTALLYGATLDYGFDYDDYHFVRPYTTGDVAATFRGTWDAQGIERPFFRPLTIAAFAVRFAWLGLNARAYHALSLASFVLASVLAGLVVAGLTNRWSAGLAGTIAFAVHPAMPYSLVAWVTNQMHLLEIVVILGALVWWIGVRARPVAWWLPLLAAAAAVFLIKEDGVMLLPTIAVLHALRRRMLEPALPPVPRAFVVCAVLLVAGLVAARSVALGGVGGYALPSAIDACRNLALGLDRVIRLVPADRPWQLLASSVATGLPLAGLAVWRQATAGARCTMASGAAIAVLFNLPFAFVTKPEQMHVVAFGAVVLVCGSALAVVDAARNRVARAGLAAVLAAGVLASAAVSRDISHDFEPFGPIVQSRDRLVVEWGPVSDDLRGFVARKAAANPVDVLPLVVLGVHPFETSPAGIRYRWMATSRVEIHVSPMVREVTVPLRHEAGAFREPARVELYSDGHLADRLDLADTDWHLARIALRPFRSMPIARMHRIVVSIPHAWIPLTIIPGSTDGRVLGLQIGDVRIR